MAIRANGSLFLEGLRPASSSPRSTCRSSPIRTQPRQAQFSKAPATSGEHKTGAAARRIWRQAAPSLRPPELIRLAATSSLFAADPDPPAINHHLFAAFTHLAALGEPSTGATGDPAPPAS